MRCCRETYGKPFRDQPKTQQDFRVGSRIGIQSQQTIHEGPVKSIQPRRDSLRCIHIRNQDQSVVFQESALRMCSVRLEPYCMIDWLSFTSRTTRDVHSETHEYDGDSQCPQPPDKRGECTAEEQLREASGCLRSSRDDWCSYSIIL
jgi:hypothetical protein